MTVRANRLAPEALQALGFAALLVLSAQIRFYPPGQPVPVTMQTAAVLLCGFCLRPGVAVSAVVLYLALGFAAALGAAQMPFFAALRFGGSAATLGYLVGFAPAAGLVSLLARRATPLTLGRSLAVGLAGTALVFLFGVTWLAMLTGSLETAIRHGLVPFVGWAAVKIAVAAGLVQAGGLVRGH